MALRTVTHKQQELRQITIHVPHYLTDFYANTGLITGGLIFGHWLDLDRFLVQLWESCSIRPTFVRMSLKGE